MAIKGKKKPKARSGRVVTAGPRPAYVPPKVPVMQRTGAKFLVALIAETLIFALLVGFGEQSRADRQQARIGEFTSLVDAALSSGGEAIQPLPGGAQVLPGLPSRLSQLEGGEPLGEEVVIPEAEAWVSALTRAADGVGGVEVPGEDLDPTQRLALTEARSLMERGLRMFVGLADELQVAIQIKGGPQTDLVATMQQQLGVANETFNAGYGKLQEVRRVAGLPTSASVPGGGFPPPLPPGFDPTMPGFDPTMPGGVTEIPVDPGAEGGDGGQGGGGGGGGNG
jgi:hypothetical protein